MTTNAADSGSGSLLRVPFAAFLGFGLVMVVYSAAGLADIIKYRMPAVVWFAVAVGASGYLVHYLRYPQSQSRTDTAAPEDNSFYVPLEAQFGVALVFALYGVGVLSGIVKYRIPAALWFAVAAGLFGYAGHRIRRS